MAKISTSTCCSITGSILTILGVLCFFGGLAISEATAGRQYLLFLAFLGVTIIPALLTLACWFARTHALTAAKTPSRGSDGNGTDNRHKEISYASC